ncbi:MAG: 50S ribosomal protein L22 [Patescibacteria group bacterium]
MRAVLSNFKQSPRKVRLVADMIRGKSVVAARDMLAFTPKKSSPELHKLLNSAIANARSLGMNAEDLFVEAITVDKGTVLRRMKPMARGRGARINRTMSIVKLELGTVPAVQASKAEKAVKSATPKKSARKTTFRKSSKSSSLVTSNQ